MDLIELIRKTADAERGERVLDHTFGPREHDPVSVSRMQKAATADPQLLKIAAWAAGEEDSLEMYELLGGTFEGVG